MVARAEDASTVFVGSENAGRFVSSLSSVGDTDDAYDVVIVRHRKPSKIDSVDDASSFRGVARRAVVESHARRTVV